MERLAISAPVTNNDIAKYYDTHQLIYNLFWSPTALHYGFWYDDTKTLAEAIVNTNKFVVGALAIDSSDVVLDAGCGVGGTSLYIAETTGARVEGVTLSGVQLEIAKKKASRSKAVGLLNFSQQDYAHTNFEAGTFSKVFGIESICHAHSKLDFLKEAYRIMKPGGKIAVVDGFLTKEDFDPEQQEILKKFIEGWAAPNLSTKDQFAESLGQAGFKNVVFHDMQDKVEKSAWRLYRYSLLTYPINFILSRLGLARENFSARYQKLAFDRKLLIYGVFVAVKP